MAAILKYQLQVTEKQTFKLPANSRILSVQYQNGSLCMWAYVNPPAEPIERTIRIVGTGHQLPEDFSVHHDFIATVQKDQFVWHIFEEL